MPLLPFHFKKFSVEQHGAAHPVGTDAVLLGAWTDVQNANRFLDIGTGTGVIALMLAQRLAEMKIKSHWQGVGVELHPPSAALAGENFAASPWAAQLAIWEGSIQEFAETQGQFDLIVSNPPFFSELTVSPDKVRSLGRHTATLSPGDLVTAVAGLLAPNGRFCAILPKLEAQLLCELAIPLGLYWTRIADVHGRPGKPVERLMLQFEKSPYNLHREQICVYAEKSGPAYSSEFSFMTRGFYL